MSEFGDRQKPEVKENYEPINIIDANLELLHYFFHTGCLPWWCEPLNQKHLEKSFTHLLTKAPKILRNLLQNSLTQEKPRQRILEQFSEAIRLEILKLLAPTWYSVIHPYFTDIQTLTPVVKSWQNVDFLRLKPIIWQGFLLQLALHPISKPSIDIILRENLLHIATQLKIEWRSLIAELQSAIAILTASGTKFSSELPQTLINSSPKRIRQLSSPESKIIKNIKNLIELLTKLQDLDFTVPNIASYNSSIKTTLKQINNLITQESSISLDSQLKYLPQLILTCETQITALEKQARSPSLNQILSEIKTVIQAIFDHSLTTQNPISQLISQPEIFPLTTSESLLHKKLDERIEADPFNNSSVAFRNNSEIYIQNSGLILLWPFLNRFFETLSLVQSGKFITSQTAHRAILILQYLVDGSTESLEYLLPLNKLLCGKSLEEPIPNSLVLSKDEQNECEELLCAVIQNWSVLKNISIDGLKRGFLQRNGVLKFKNDHLLLQVEHKTHDILIDQMPWSIRIIKLPYMLQILHVEW
ncbi:contractile injection system tape measure protein [Pleurocapsa sp. PCC 7319]|uniref:contractile injection system tape measure protein n=1 Tax=Pleurocapsa sp. PCC 7319 TaxID=118161 RepID=UPI00034D97C8|nr:contractile injection system tape measure protein [Pleurocapsa sp. PCC 7319]